jgi:hypothetical protein
LDAGRAVVGVPIVISNGETRFGNIFFLAVLYATRHRSNRPATSADVTITNLKVLLVKRRGMIHPAMGSLDDTSYLRRGYVCKALKPNSWWSGFR